jgi:hypothetical protein
VQSDNRQFGVPAGIMSDRSNRISSSDRPSVRAGTLNRYLSATLTSKERLRARGAPKLKIRSGHFLEVVIVDFSSAGRHQENFGRTSTKNAQAAKSANAHCNFGAPRALRRSLSVIHSGTDLTSRPGLTVQCEMAKTLIARKDRGSARVVWGLGLTVYGDLRFGVWNLVVLELGIQRIVRCSKLS